MSDIWHTPPQTPDVFKSHPIIVVYEAGDEIEQMDSKEYSDLVGERYVNRWCYVDDLIKENDRTRKALDLALAELQEIDGVCDDNKYADNVYVGLDGQDTRNIALDVKKTLAEITALEQKNHFADTSKKVEQKDVK